MPNDEGDALFGSLSLGILVIQALVLSHSPSAFTTRLDPKVALSSWLSLVVGYRNQPLL